MEMNIEKMAIKVVEKVLDDLLYKGKTLREWIDLIIKFEKDKNKILRHCWECKNRQTYKCTICKNNSQFEEVKEDTRFICNTCRKKYICSYYEYAKSFIEENPNNDMKCQMYIK